MQKKTKIQLESMGIEEIKSALNDIWTELTELNRLVNVFENADFLELTLAQQVKLKDKATVIKQKVTAKLDVLPF